MAKVREKLICGADVRQCARQQWVTRGRRCRFFQFTVRLFAWVLVGSSCLNAQSNPTEYEVKAAYLYNFGRFVEWPAKVTAASEYFSICVLGEDPFGATFDATIAGESINGKKVVVARITKPQDAASCRILFISSSEESRLKEILATLDKTSVLTVSDISQFTRRGGMIRFVTEANRVRFEVNLAIAQHAGLTLSSQLLKVAISVKRSSQAGD
ncbi:MAG TPA: YfiR family protein [Candidatus Dormibacteraeota bacterium]|nr:YfiR family protein [Candidatus Dormibacteraeota bacterium]